MKAHSEAVIRKNREAPGLVPSGVLIARRGSAMIDVMSNPVGQSMFFLAQRSLTVSHAWLHLLAAQLNMMCCIVSVVSQLWQMPRSS